MSFDVKEKNRIKSLIYRESIDRVPVIPHIEAFAGRVCGIGTKEFYLNPRLSYETQIKCQKLFGYDGGVGYGIPYGFTEEFGGKIEFPEAPVLGYPKIISKPVNCEKDVENLKIPDINKSFYGSKLLAFNKIAYENGKGVNISAGSPMNIANGIAGIDLLLRWIIKKPELVHHIMRICTDYIIIVAKRHAELFGAENISAGIACPLECRSIMSSKMFEKFSLPYIKEIYDRFDNMGINISSVHLCGDHTKNLSYWKNDIVLKERTIVTTGTEFDLCDLGEELGESYIIRGNLRNTTLQLGTPEDVYNEAKELIIKMKHFKGGYILTPDCTLSFLTPLKNLTAMINAADDYGAY